MALNGILESFVYAVATAKQLNKLNYILGCITIIYLGISYILINNIEKKAIGVIIANQLNMILRILYCLYFIKNYFKKIQTIKLKNIKFSNYIYLIF